MKELLQRMVDATGTGDIPSAARAEHEFRHMLYAIGGNSILVDLIDRAWNLFPGSILWNIPGRIKQSLKEHRSILDAVNRRDPTAVAFAIENHLLSALAALEAHVASFTKRSSSSPRSQS
jgi:DNA-binding GntR family transcriptional regulator